MLIILRVRFVPMRSHLFCEIRLDLKKKKKPSYTDSVRLTPLAEGYLPPIRKLARVLDWKKNVVYDYSVEKEMRMRPRSLHHLSRFR